MSGELMEMNQTRSTTVSSHPFDETGMIVAAVTLLPLSVFGTVANIITIIVVLSSTRLRSTFYFLMMSLSASDLLSAIFSVIFLYIDTWGFYDIYFPNFLCKIYWAIDVWTSYVTTLHIIIFALLRFVSVQWPHKFNSFTLATTKIVISVIWMVTFLIGFVPFFLFFATNVPQSATVVPHGPTCTVDFTKRAELQLYLLIAYPLLYLLPILVVIVLASATATKILLLQRKRSLMRGSNRNTNVPTPEAKRRRKEQRMIMQLGLVVGSFLFGYIPITAFHWFAISGVVPSSSPIRWWFGVLAYLALRISECLNPVFYNLSSREMRVETKAICQRLCGRQRKSYRRRSDLSGLNTNAVNAVSSKV